MGRPQISLLK